jgi:guanylate kinase
MLFGKLNKLVATRQQPAANRFLNMPAKNCYKLRNQVHGKLIIVSAPSGAGKTTIVRHLLSLDLNLAFSVSATSRQPRSGEKEGVDYYFFSVEEFRNCINNDAFLEWEEVYTGIFYGTLKKEVNRLLENGRNVIFDVDVVGGLDLKEIYGENALAIFVSPPSIDVLRVRLKSRSTESEEKIAVRIAKAAAEMEFAPKFDVILVNDVLEDALLQAERITKHFLYADFLF